MEFRKRAHSGAASELNDPFPPLAFAGLFPDGQKISENGIGAFRPEAEIRHVGMTDMDALPETVGKRVRIIACEHGPQRRRIGARALALGADGMAGCTLRPGDGTAVFDKGRIRSRRDSNAAFRRTGFSAAGGKTENQCSCAMLQRRPNGAPA